MTVSSAVLTTGAGVLSTKGIDSSLIKEKQSVHFVYY
jgi:hypothetical protein